MNIPALNFDHSHHKLKIRGLQSPVDVLTFYRPRTAQLPLPLRHSVYQPR
ncbi:VGR-related protein [Escherichia coli]|uniref:VGR-related protein n=1 Tax=Escherichia coli TaxID=562 RepID=A0A377K369_ECOLX|nr:VGR-related protein [Escherichia coli]